VTLAQLLAGPPSLLAWRRICAALDDGADIDAVDAACAGWPADLRRAPGRWLRDLLEGRRQPKLQVTRAIDLTLQETGVEDRLAWTDAPELAQATIVRVLDERLGDEGVERLLGSANFLKIEELALASGISDRGARLLAEDERLAGLRCLALFRNQIGADGVAALIARPSALRRLLLGRNRLGVAGARVLAGPTGVSLELLDLDCDRMDGEAVQALVGPLLGGLRILNLSNNPIGLAGCAALAGCHFNRLEVLYLHGCGLDDEAVATLLRAPWLPRLKNLALSDNALSMASVERLVAGPALELDELDICHNPGIREDVAGPQLRAAPQLAGLHRLCS
jgi:hypothetical protein